MRHSRRILHLTGWSTVLAALVISCSTLPEPATDGGDRGARLYARHCAVCHGVRGTGGALPEGTLLPPARDFSTGLFNIVSTDNGLPTDADLESVLRRGIPGSAMPSFDWLPKEDLQSLVAHVRELAVTEMAAQMAESSEGTMTEEAALEQASKWFVPGAPLSVPAAVEPSQAILTRGKGLYTRMCAACHGAQGTGWQPLVKWAGRKTIHWARDFTAGVMKGGFTHADLAHRIQAGMPGSSMPPADIDDPADLAAVITYVQSLAPADANARLVQEQTTIRAVYREKRLRLSPEDEAWSDVPRTEVVLSPMRWRSDSVVLAAVQAVHDGDAIEFRVSWADPTRDEPALGEEGPTDRAAIQLTNDAEASFFGMGSKRHPVTIWYWHPQPARLAAGVLDLIGTPHGSIADVRPKVRLPSAAQVLSAKGPDSAPSFPGQDRFVASRATWKDGRWAVVFRRDLSPGGKERLVFDSKVTLRVAFAIWDGAVSRARSDKSFTIWHNLQIDAGGGGR